MNISKIEWTDRTWAVTRGCTQKNEHGKECINCYAQGQAHRFSGPGGAYEGLTVLGKNGPVWNGKIALNAKVLLHPFGIKKPQNIFVNSMSDLFHDKVPFEYIDQVFAAMALAKQHTFQVLTKRAERMHKYLAQRDIRRNIEGGARKLGFTFEFDNQLMMDWPLRNVQLGISAGTQSALEERCKYLLCAPAAFRFISAEPLLGPLDFNALSDQDWNYNALSGLRENPFCDVVARENGPRIDLVIGGGESGPRARPMHPLWIRSIRDQCIKYGAGFFFKQWGEWLPGHHYTPELQERDMDFSQSRYRCAQFDEDRGWQIGYPHASEVGDHALYKVGKKSAGRLLDGREWNGEKE